MGFVGLVQFAVKYFVDFLAWPLFALGYPLCASVRAIEHNSVSDTQKLNTYWVVFSLILLLEHVLNLLEWLLLWQYIRLMIVCWLVVPYFDGAFYVYKNLIHPCLSMDLQNVINWFNKRMESLYAKDNFLTEMEKYINENGPEALEKIIARKNLDVKDIKAAPSTENKEVEQLNSERPTVTQKDIRPVEVLEKNEVKAPKQDSGVQRNVTRVEDRNFAGPQIKKPVPEVATQRELPQWTCEICNITLQSASAFHYHLEGKNHQAAVEALKAKNQSSGPKVVHNFAAPEIKKPVREVAAQRELPQASASSKGQKWTCEICHMTLESVITLNSHLQGKKHKAAVEAQKAKNQSSGPKVASASIRKNSNVPNVEPGKRETQKGFPGNAEVRGRKQASPASVPRKSVQAQQPMKPNIGSIGIDKSSLWCRICDAKCTRESDLVAHLGGRRHLAALQQASTRFDLRI
ncbi:uncharacterized protein LOC107426540 isoform X1 [Ziziphus jujuba]|uniref:Uncharacterized protein LOC107426540 isoform X1 n=2 Tax=Ziziphus jujuba TaxID=326968 RepID=A0A6P4A8H5_ZIZJJ|nr:uncharacterized protein LOC107426540 isoform X1 [Ziziphus jujuba]